MALAMFFFFFFFYSFKAFHVGKDSWGSSMWALQGFLGKADFEPRYLAPPSHAPILFSQKPLQQIGSLELPVYVYRLYFFTCRRGWAQEATIWLWVGRRIS